MSTRDRGQRAEGRGQKPTVAQHGRAHLQPRAGEVPQKQWIAEEAERQGIKAGAMKERLFRSRFHGVQRRHVNSCVVFVITGPTEQRTEAT